MLSFLREQNNYYNQWIRKGVKGVVNVRLAQDIIYMYMEQIYRIFFYFFIMLEEHIL